MLKISVFRAEIKLSSDRRSRIRGMFRTLDIICLVMLFSATAAQKIPYTGVFLSSVRSGRLLRNVLSYNSIAEYRPSKTMAKQLQGRKSPTEILVFCSLQQPWTKCAKSVSTISGMDNSSRFRPQQHSPLKPNLTNSQKPHIPKFSEPRSFGNRIKTSLYASTSDIASSSPNSSKHTLPNWWPLSSSYNKHITFAHHVAHVIVPNNTSNKKVTKENYDNIDVSATEEKDIGLNCEEIVQWVLHHARNRTDQSLSQPHNFCNITGTGEREDANSMSRNARICDEWNYCECMSEMYIRRHEKREPWDEGFEQHDKLDPAYRHDPALLPQRSNTDDNGPYLNAAELFALGSVWYLPYSSATSIVDRFDPSSGVKPQRLNVGDMNRTVFWGDYFRVHFNPRRFTETNGFDWGSMFEDGHACRSNQNFDTNSDDMISKPGIIVARDDNAGYLVINKPPNVPVHPTVDNLLENVASSIGRCLWNERKEAMTSGEYLLNHTTTETRRNSHPSLSNNVQHSHKSKINKRKQKKQPVVYVATPQRLDQNTSGLLVVASKKSFAAYFAKLLRTKTNGQLISGGVGRNSTAIIDDIDVTLASQSTSSCGVHKTYRCLVCIMPSAKLDKNSGTLGIESMTTEVERLIKYQTQGTVIRHFLEPSIRAPKRFLATIPAGVEDNESWAECLLKITKVRDVCTVVGNAPSDSLAKDLWGLHGKPNEACAVAELEIELLTGRTHQIRGQLAAINFPLVGDVQYGGAIPSSSSHCPTSFENKQNANKEIQSYMDSEKLALQCCSLEFLDPQYSEDELENNVKRSNKWNSFSLDNAFWTSFLHNYHDESAKLSSSEITSMFDEETAFRDSSDKILPSSTVSVLNVKLPPRVLLSHGANKYVMVKAWRSDGDHVMGNASDIADSNALWFVRSASPSECGGPYHANVAEGILRELAELGFMTQVTGGGRIDYCVSKDISHAHVFGFSFGFGKGNHEFVASIIEEFTDAVATYDNSDKLY